MTQLEFQSTLPARGATFALCKDLQLAIFQSTLPARGATDSVRLSTMQASSNFNPRSPHGERPAALTATVSSGEFQSTLPARGATEFDFTDIYTAEFQSTLPARGATCSTSLISWAVMISIHAPRTGSDAILSQPSSLLIDISIHAPRTGSDALWICTFYPCASLFQSTLPARGATDAVPQLFRFRRISIHAPRTGSDD